MNQADYIELIDLLETGLRDAEGLDVDDPSLYAEREPESGELRRRHPRDHVVELLRALDRHLAVTDRGTYDRAIETINESIEGPRVVGASIILLDDSRQVRLDALPDLSVARSRLEELIQGILADPEPDRETDR